MIETILALSLGAAIGIGGFILLIRVLAEDESQLERNFCPRCGKRTNDIHTCTPPQRTWVDLTQQEIDELDEQSPSIYDFVQNLMSKLKEKNT